MATLKISDLSVGDWVEIDHEDFGWQPAQINVCGDLGIGAYFKDIDPEEEYDCTLSQARPIPITAEILEKNGWRVIEKEVLGDEYEYDGEKRVWDDYNIDICETKPGVFWYSWRTEYYMWRLEYVHQLQHLIRLAGVDKEINL
jgi:hypothetical protein